MTDKQKIAELEARVRQLELQHDYYDPTERQPGPIIPRGEARKLQPWAWEILREMNKGGN